MDNDSQKALGKTKEIFHGLVKNIEVPWENSAWSHCYKISLNNNKTYFLKGTPRQRKEATVTKHLHILLPNIVPEVINDDLIPESTWRWFLVANAGTCSYEGIEARYALKAAFNLGNLQRMTFIEGSLFSELLPQCEAQRLQEAVDNVGRWALKFSNAEESEIIQRLLSISSDHYEDHVNNLNSIPSTCVHKDFWSGNIAVTDENVMLIDWGDALWGVGGISIVNMISTDDDLSSLSSIIWDEYFKGLDRKFDKDYIKSSQIAYLVSELVTEQEIADLQRRKYGPGLIPSVRRLYKELTRKRNDS
ncbi:Phosphotransferase enzyme family protein [Paenibacillus sp. UNCCL117]|uniref:phosphotransferase n=1 Tax=unclassified Paenibacillus TaxID=185978 RepID=UPI00088F0565|nr:MULTISPECIES: phosphotransferase [unclassified Paenibacillus]SDD84804.1 Phosphotransferase enzyme family protein [Paenibacillus sp. cl123]SFW54527.1 Phosphotransferase enzyme family protein [Paenibacillus sp. UNCCL117]